MDNVAILGATGSIGLSTLKVIAANPDAFNVFAMSAHRRIDELIALAKIHHPKILVVADKAQAALVSDALPNKSVFYGTDALNDIAQHPDVQTVVAGIVGAAGLVPSLSALGAGKRLLLANKEPLVMAGQLFMDVRAKGGGEILPVDSEHNAIFQAMPADFRIGQWHTAVSKIWLTASGGPFRQSSLAQMQQATPQAAAAHPTWAMGPKISVDSATLMNKGLEYIEACWLFGAHPDAVDIVVHPQSVVHSIVEMKDSSCIAQMGPTDMCIPIAHCLAYPKRITSTIKPVDWRCMQDLQFEAPDVKRFPALALAKAAHVAGGSAACVLNAANEVAVATFLAGHIGFMDIPGAIEAQLSGDWSSKVDAIDDLLTLDARVRAATQAWCMAKAA